MAQSIRKLVSKIDSSVNWVIPYKTSVVEARYVRRNPNYISAYLSSQNGCKMACKFCWLTASKQVTFEQVDIPTFVSQLEHVLNHAQTVDVDEEKRKNVRININMMSRGEALANKFIVNQYPNFYESLQNLIKEKGYGNMKMNISTIMPNTVRNHDLTDIFGSVGNNIYNTNLYYSLYSVKDKFRKEWIPNAMPWKTALLKLKKYQLDTNNTIAIHFALIENENDNLEEVQEMCDELRKFEFSKLKFNLVRFNPHPSMNKYKEPTIEKMNSIFEMLKTVSKDNEITTNKSRIVPRAGPDTFASCGMFIDEDDM